ncbi:unnamed protein product [Darwinula stevensoni]|uniref:WD repeat-containing protein 89 n=1 Tax=Darwinula stevensoni TaxID=69355 RepID=A0A7R8X922_9CRUS|nr:unnamed protein product [Darwinula stevensoni]CAG0882137.1 unnamed protein product [Darwinula stevensoni]
MENGLNSTNRVGHNNDSPNAVISQPSFGKKPGEDPDYQFHVLAEEPINDSDEYTDSDSDSSSSSESEGSSYDSDDEGEAEDGIIPPGADFADQLERASRGKPFQSWVQPRITEEIRAPLESKDLNGVANDTVKKSPPPTKQLDISDLLEEPTSKKRKRDDDEDGDSCNLKELCTTFAVPYHVARRTAVSTEEETYVLHVDANLDSPDALIAAGLSNPCIHVYNAERLALIAKLKGHSDVITGVKFCNTRPQVLLTGGREGSLRLWDLRTKPYSCIHTYSGNEMTRNPGRTKHITCFDLDCQDRILCAGTEQLFGDAYLLFWDIRSTRLMGGYWYSHGDDVTQVRFHPNEGDTLATASVDGLLNIFDLEQNEEDDALMHTLNADCSLRTVNWYGQCDRWGFLSCITHNEDLQLWNRADVNPYASFSRIDISTEMRRKSSNYVYLVDVHKRTNDELLILCGSSYRENGCLRLLRVQNNRLRPHALLPQTKFDTQIVRASHLFQASEVLLTAGEEGIINLWSPGDPDEISHDSSFINAVSPSNTQEETGVDLIEEYSNGQASSPESDMNGT